MGYFYPFDVWIFFTPYLLELMDNKSTLKVGCYRFFPYMGGWINFFFNKYTEGLETFDFFNI